MNINNDFWVYVAAPYTHDDPIINTQHAVAAGERLINAGCVPVVPHLTMLWHLISPHNIDYWYAYDMRLLERCNALVRLPGPSTGADAEVIRARQLDIAVWDSLDAFLAARNL